MESTKKVAIVGAGITGLTLAYYLKKAGIPVVVFEKEKRVGGVIETVTKNGFTFETGPNSGVLSNSAVVQLLEDMKPYCQTEIANKNAAKRLIWKGKRWHPLPSNPLSGIVTPLFSMRDKLGIVGEPFRKKGTDPLESLASMVKRRLGKSFLDYAVDPFILGIYAGDPDYIVPKYALPKLYNLEQQYGSFIKGAIQKRNKPVSEEQKMATREIFSIEGGLQNLVDGLQQAIGSSPIKTGCDNLTINRQQNDYKVTGTNQSPEYFTHVVSTVNPSAYKTLFPFLTEAHRNIFEWLPYAKVTGVSIGFKNWNGIPLDAFGGLIPFKENRDILGVLFMSSMFKNRAPEKGALLNLFMGGVRRPRLATLPDDVLKKVVEKELREMLQIKDFNPDLFHIERYNRAIAQYGKESLERIKTIHYLEEKYQGFTLAGSVIDGVGIADRVQQAVTIAKKITIHS